MIYSGQTIMLSTCDSNNKVACKQVTKRTAKRLFENGKKVWLHSCNLTVSNMWQNPYYFQKKESDENFDNIVNSFRYYNCDAQRGKRVIFFVMVEDIN